MQENKAKQTVKKQEEKNPHQLKKKQVISSSFQDSRASTEKLVQLQKDINQSDIVQKKDNKTGLPDNIKSGVENLSGVDISDTKVHYNSSKPAQLGAHAYAQGSNIHVASGQEKHLAHEAWHVVQQKQGRVNPTTSVNGESVNDNPSLENEADVMGAKASQLKTDDTTAMSNKVVSNQKNTSQLAKNGEVIQAMFGTNTDAIIRTDQGSVYVIKGTGLVRYKVAVNEIHDRVGKNIYYVSGGDGARILAAGEAGLAGSTLNADSTILNFTIGGAAATANLVGAAAVGLSTFDAYFDGTGLYVGGGHVGHPIDSVNVTEEELQQAMKACKGGLGI